MAIDLTYVKGVGPNRAKVLANELEMHSGEEMLEYFPYRYVDRRRVYKISELDANAAYVQILGRFVQWQENGQGARHRMVAQFTDGTGSIDVVWFQSVKTLKDILNTQDLFLLFGKPTVFNGRLNMVHPEMERNPDQDKRGEALTPMYETTEAMKRCGLNSKQVGKIIGNIFTTLTLSGIRETLPAWLITQHHIMGRAQALWTVHNPTDQEGLKHARFRLKFEELFYIQLALLRNRNRTRQQVMGIRFDRPGPQLNELYRHHLQFEPTGAQKRVVHEIWNDLRSGRQMNRLVQGDVGSGKTLVAFMSMLMVTGNGRQACLMAPTEILAQQHFEGLSKQLGDMNVRIALLTGSIKGAARKRTLEALAQGEINILVGTHALIEPTVIFKDLALCVIDEQHRFGVEQRAKLWRKNATPPHVLVMTATPIPRTLAMTVYGDLDVSVIDEMPPGRKPVQTEHYYHHNRNRLNMFIRNELQKGRQVYVVYPLIKESERADYKNLMEGYEFMRQCFPEYEICMVHGQLNAEQKESAMQRFVSGAARIMVATTVIEVGVNVPNASVMVIESAERFGLSQLHQLRGRVGRGADQSYCILMTPMEMARETRRRIEIMCSTTDGFEIAEADMRMRGPGDIEGTQQSGVPFRLRMADLARDGEIVNFARERAEEILKMDPLLTSPNSIVLTQRLAELQGNAKNWSMIS